MLPKLITSLPGPKARAIIERDKQVISPSYTRSYPLVAARGEGAIVEDPDGNRFLDFAAGIAVVATGHCHPKVVKAIQEQAAKLIHMSGTDFYYENMVALAEKLAALVPAWACWKWSTTRLLWQFRDRSDRGGDQAGSLPHRAGPVRGVPGRVPWENHGLAGADGEQERAAKGVLSGDAGRASRAVRLLLPLRVWEDAGFLRGRVRARRSKPSYSAPRCRRRTSPRSSWNRYRGKAVTWCLLEKFFDELRRLAVKHGILLVADEVQSGMGRTGKMFASEHFGLEPDVIALAKGIASGMPLGATVARAELMDWKPGAHASTFGGNPVAVAASLATIELLEQELVDNAARVGAHLMERLRDLPQRFPIVGDVRGLGLMIGIELVRDQSDEGTCGGSARPSGPDVLRARAAGAGGGSEHDPAVPAAGDHEGSGGFRGRRRSRSACGC